MTQTPLDRTRAPWAGPRAPRGVRSVLLALAVVLAGLAAPAGAQPDPDSLDLTTFDFEQRFFFEPGTYLKDHTLIEHDGRFHIFYIVGNHGENWTQPGNEIDFGHASSADLVHWEIHPRVIPAIPDTWKARNVWAPHVIPDNGQFLMAYTGLDDDIVQQAGIATSPDLFDWTDLSAAEAAYAPDTTWALWSPGSWSNCRDPYIRRLSTSNQWIMINTASARPEYAGVELGALSLGLSTDGITWTDAGQPLVLNNTAAVLESPFVYEHGGLYYLMFTEQNVTGVQYTTSDSLLSGWDVTQAQVLDTGLAGEIVDALGLTWFTRVRGVTHPDSSVGLGALIDSLDFQGGLPVIGESNLLWRDWTALPGGDAFVVQPTFGDRPFARTGIQSNVEGNFWINTAEQYYGPLGPDGCHECPPDESLTGVLRSRVFKVRAGNRLELRVGGGDDPDSLQVNLRRAGDDAILFSETGTGDDVMTPRTWDLSTLVTEPNGEPPQLYIEIADLSVTGHINVDAIAERPRPPTGIGESGAPQHGSTGRLRAAPNPSTTPTVLYELEHETRVRVVVYDTQGRAVRTLVNEMRGPGAHRHRWDGTLASGGEAPSGVYFVRLSAGGTTQTTRVVRVR